MSFYFSMKYFGERRVLAKAEGPWVTFYDQFASNGRDASTLKSTTLPLFLVYVPNLSVLGEITAFVPTESPADTNPFYRINLNIVDPAALRENLTYCEVQAAANISIDVLKLRILEMSYGFIPSFQYQVEKFYRRLSKDVVAQMSTVDEAFRGKERRAEFSRLFHSLIFPRLSELGFEQDRRSMRVVRRTAELAVFIDFCHISFGSGSYQVSLIWMGSPDAAFDDECAIGRLEPWFPYHSNLILNSKNAQILAYSVKEWLRVFDLYLAKYVSRYQTLEEVDAWRRRNRELEADKAQLGLPPMSPRHAYVLSR